MTPTRAVPLVLALAALACTPKPTDTFDPTKLESGALEAGAGEHLIDLPIGHPTAGYALSPLLGQFPPADDPGSPYADMFASTRGMQSPPTAKVTVFDNGHSRLVLAKIDAVFITDVLTERVIQLAKSTLHTDIEGQLILTATHTHDAGCRFSRKSVVPDLANGLPDPETNALAHGADTYSQESTDRVAKSIVAALGDALRTLRPAKFGYVQGTDDQAGHDRRCENDWLYGPNFHQKEVTVIRVDDAKTGDPIAVLFSYAMHGTFYSGGNHNLSVDAPGTAEIALERLFKKPVVAMYLQGSAGDASPSGNGNDASQAMAYAGWELAHTVKSLYDGITDLKTSIPVAAKERWVPTTHDLLGYKKDEFFQDGRILCFQLVSSQCPATPAATDPTTMGQLCPITVLPDEGKYQTRVATGMLGDLAILTVPGEPVNAVGRALEQKALGEKLGFKAAMVLGYSNDHNGYILFDQDWLSGGYEPTISFWGWKMGTYLVDQAADTLHEMMTGKASAKHPVTLPDLSPDKYTPVKPAEAKTAPGVATDVEARRERLETAHFSFFGGDPGEGTPEVVLQKKQQDGSFATVTENGWLPVSNLRTDELPLIYWPDPTYKAEPAATSRTHRYDVQYDVPFDLDLGTYRFEAKGKAITSGAEHDYAVDSSPFEVVPSTKLSVDGKIASANGKLEVDATVLYPAQVPVYAPKPDNEWQIANFRLVEPPFASPFAPVLQGLTVTAGTVAKDGGDAEALSLAMNAEPLPDVTTERYAPGEGPGLHAELDGAQTGHYVVTIPAGALVDSFGNTNGVDVSFEADVP